MLKIWFTHAIYEQCLNSLFNNMSKNFATKIDKFKVGQSFAAIYLIHDQWSVTTTYEVILENAIILEINNNVLFVEYDIMEIIDGPNDKHTVSIVRDVDEVLIEDIIRIDY